eukprot:gene12808-16067_t
MLIPRNLCFRSAALMANLQIVGLTPAEMDFPAGLFTSQLACVYQGNTGNNAASLSTKAATFLGPTDIPQQRYTRSTPCPHREHALPLTPPSPERHNSSSSHCYFQDPPLLRS